MNEIVFKALELVVMVVVAVVIGKIIPMIREHIRQEQIDSFRVWVEDVVAYAQQVFIRNGDKKEIATEVLRKIRDAEGLMLTNEQIDILIESAVKQLKIMEGAAANVETIINEIEYIEEEEHGTA